MSDAVQVALITSIPATLAAIFSYLASRRSADAAATARDTQVIAKKTEENTNHLKDELVELTAKSSHAEGKLEAQNEAKGNGGTDAG